MEDPQNCFAMRMSIGNFLLCTQKLGDMLKSLPFKEDPNGSQKWTIGVYPRGIYKENYVSIELINKQKEYDSLHFTVSIIGDDGSPHNSKEISTKNSNQPTRIPKFIKRSDLAHQKESLLPLGTLTLQCVVRKPCKLVEACHEIVSNLVTFTWYIKGLYDYTQSASRTQTFKFDGIDNSPKCFLSFPVEKLSSGEAEARVVFNKISCYKERFADYNKRDPRGLEDFSIDCHMDNPVSILFEVFAQNDNDMTRTFFVGGEHVFHPSSEDESFSSETVIVDESKHKERGFLIDDTLSLLVKLRFSDGRVCQNPDTKYGYFVPEPKLSSTENPWKKIYEDMKFCDVVVRIGTDSFPAHRAVLSSQSEVFEAMFCNNMIENNTGVVDVTDIDADSMKRLIKLFYTGEVDDDMSFEDVINLNAAAHNYQVRSLEPVISLLISKITEENVWEVWQNAILLENNALKIASKAFISTNTSKSLDTLMNSEFQILPSSLNSNSDTDISDGQPLKKRRI